MFRYTVLALREWCGMPLITRVLTVIETRQVPLSTEAETYAQAEIHFHGAVSSHGQEEMQDVFQKSTGILDLARVQMYHYLLLSI